MENRQGDNSHRHKLTAADVCDIVLAYKQACAAGRGYGTLAWLAREYGVSRQAIRDIFAGRHWGSVTGIRPCVAPAAAPTQGQIPCQD